MGVQHYYSTESERSPQVTAVLPDARLTDSNGGLQTTASKGTSTLTSYIHIQERERERGGGGEAEGY